MDVGLRQRLLRLAELAHLEADLPEPEPRRRRRVEAARVDVVGLGLLQQPTIHVHRSEPQVDVDVGVGRVLLECQLVVLDRVVVPFRQEEDVAKLRQRLQVLLVPM